VKSGSALKQNPSVEDYDMARAEVEGLTADWNTYTKALTDAAAKFEADADALKTLWQAQVDTAADDAAAAAALRALTNPLAPEAVDLWKALIDAKNTLAAQEKAYQDQKAADEAAARTAKRGGSSGGSGSNGSGGNTGGGYSLNAIAAALAAQLGIPASQMTCYDISNGVRCDWPGGSRTYTI
jgi:membrane protein involved in colicin uptake